MSPRFVHLHTHSHYSFLQALPKVPELVEKAKANGMAALGLTDAGNLHGAIEFYKEANAAGIKPILGVDAYLAPHSRFDKDRSQQEERKRSRLVLLAENNEGYKNLLYLITKSFTEGFLERPRMDRAMLRERGTGLIALIPSFAGDVAGCIRAGDADGASAVLAEYVELFGADRVFLEITRHPSVEGHEKTMRGVVALAKKTGTPLIAQHDVYYLSPEDREATEVMRRIQHGGEHGRNEEEDFSFVSGKQMEEWFGELPDALANSGKIADRCSVSFKLGSWVFPDFPIPAGSTHSKELRAKVYAGIPARGLTETPELLERIEYELKIIIDKGFAPYFLTVSDLLTFAKSAGILTTTRGSAAGSIVAYLTGITNVSPLTYKLPFERFLNPERPKAPDIDMDFADNRRDEMIAYAKRKYGEDRVAQVGTFGTMMARAAVRDVARALGHAHATGDRIAKLIPIGSQGFPMTIDRAFELEAELKKLYDEDDDAHEILDIARRIEGCVRHVGVHAAGVVIAPTALVEWTPLQPDPKGGKLVTQYDMHAIEDAGLLKFDFLGIKNLSILADSVERVRLGRGIIIDIENVPLEDAKTYAMLARGETEGVFQLNGSGLTRFLKELKPTTIHDINAMVALYRPGPMEVIPAYIARKNDPKLVTYPDPRMKKFLSDSYGLLVYQDDLLYSAVELAGYSWLEVDKFRKAIGKKIPAEMAAQKEKFVKGIVENGQTESFANKLWKLFEPFQAYGFNKCLTGDARVIDGETGVPERIDKLMARGRGARVNALNHAGRIVEAQAGTVRKSGVKDVYRLKTRSGREIRASANHPFLMFSGWTRLDHLSVGDRIAAPRTLPEPGNRTPLAVHEAATLGYLIAEGNLCHPHGIYYYSKAEDEIADFVLHASRFDNTRITLDRRKSAASVYVGQQNPKKGNALRGWLGAQGMLGKKATEKSIPNCVFSADAGSIALVLGKMWQGDGCVSRINAQTFYATSSRALADDVQLLLARLGIVSAIHEKSFNYRDTRKRGYTIVITGHANLETFANTAGIHLLAAKRAELRATVMDAAIGRALHAPDILLHAESDIFWDEVVSLTPEGREMTYDLTVPEQENFIANNLVVHNSHAASYGKVAYQTAYMKANYPVEYMAALLSADAGDTESIAIFVAECERLGIKVLPPDVNESGANFTVVSSSAKASEDKDGKQDAIRFGLSTIKNFGEGISDTIIEERERNGPFASLADFLSRVESKSMNRKSLESLARCGALDAFAERGAILANIETLLAFHRDATATASQDSLFGALTAPPSVALAKANPVSLSDKLAWEKELLGIYVSGHPLDAHAEMLAKARSSIASIKAEPQPGLTVVLPVLVEDVRTILTKGGEKMAFIKLADKTSSVEAVVFPRLFKQHGGLFTPGVCLLVKAKVSGRNGETSLALEEAKAL